MNDIVVRAMTPAQMRLAVDWAAKEGWNPGLHDAETFYAWDPGGFFAALNPDGEPLGFISAVAYGAGYGFIGFFIVRPDSRGHRVGVELGKAALARLAGRNIGIDGVLDKVKNYQSFGFRQAHTNSRYMGITATRNATARAPKLAGAPRKALLEYDALCFGERRDAFALAWAAQPDSAGAFLPGADGALAGYGLARKCREGFKIGPLFADGQAQAGLLLDSLLNSLPAGEKFFLDVPLANAGAVALAQERGLSPVFSTARMYNLRPHPMPLEKIFGITSFELG